MTAIRKLRRVPRPGLALLLLSICGAGTAAQQRDYVHVVGSSTLFPFTTTVAEAFGRQGRWKAPLVESVGTGGGFRLFCAGGGVATADITDASRPISASESAECARNGASEVVGIRVGLDGMLLANARSAPAFALTREQIFLALAKTVPVNGRLVANPYRRWKDISPQLPDLPISVYGPAPNHGTRDAFVELALLPACVKFPLIKALPSAEQKRSCQTLREDGAWVDVPGDYALLFRRLAENPRALGVLGFSWLERNRDRIKAASVDAVMPTAESIGSSTYPLARPLFIYVKQTHVGRIPGLAQFVQEFVSDRAIGPQGYLVDEGLMPLPPAQLQEERLKVKQLLQKAGVAP